APNPSVFGQSVLFTATVAASALTNSAPTGTVAFMEGSTTLGTGTLDSQGQATFTTSALAVANHAIVANYTGDSLFQTSSSTPLTLTVQQAATTTSLNAAPTTGIFPQAVTLTATVGVVAPGAGAPTGTVSFLDGATALGTITLNGNTAVFNTSAIVPGTHSIV